MTFKSKWFLYTLFYFTPIIDALNGYMVFNHLMFEGGTFSPSQLLRLFITLFSLLFISNKNIFRVYIFFMALLSIEYISFLFHGNVKGALTGVIYSYKLIYIALIILALKSISKKENLIDIIKLFRNGVVIYALILLISIALDISEPTYIEGTFGNKGLFSSGNGLSVFLGASSLIAYYYYSDNKTTVGLSLFLIIFLSSIVVGTKASIVFLFVVSFTLFFYINKLNKLFFIATLSLVFLLLFDTLSSYLALSFDVILFRYQNSESILTFLASNRDNYISNALIHFNIDNLGFLRVIFGAGLFLSFRNPSEINLVYDTLESDFFDVFFAFGITGLIVYLGFFISGFIKIFKKFNLLLFVGWVTLFIYSAIAGHIIFNGMSSMALAMFYLIISEHNLSNRIINPKHRSTE